MTMVVMMRLLSRVKARENNFQRSQNSQRSLSRCMAIICIFSPKQLLQPAQVVDFVASANDVQEDIFQGRIFILTAGTLAQFLQCSLGHQYTLVDNAYSRTESL